MIALPLIHTLAPAWGQGPLRHIQYEGHGSVSDPVTRAVVHSKHDSFTSSQRQVSIHSAYVPSGL